MVRSSTVNDAAVVSTKTTNYRMIGLAGAFIGGACMAVQSRVNGNLGSATSEPAVAAVISFCVGLFALSCAALIPSFRAGLVSLIRAQRARDIRWWECLGGVIGGLFVAVQTSSVAALGVALFTILVVGAQTFAALIVDHLGFGPRGRTQVTPRRLVGGVVAVAGVAISAMSSHGATAGFAVGAAILTFCVGGATQVQQALNGRVAKATASPYATTTQNFVVGLITLLVVLFVKSATGNTQLTMPQHTQWWYWVGGLLGIGFIGLTAWAARHVSVLELGLTVLLGQIIMALVLDLSDAHARALIGVGSLVGMAVTLLGAWVAASSSGRPRRSRRA